MELVAIYAEVRPTDKNKEETLIRTAMELFSDYSKDFGLVFEFIPGFGLKLYVKINPNASMHDQRVRLTGHGVSLLKKANIQGSVQVKQLVGKTALFGL